MVKEFWNYSLYEHNLFIFIQFLIQDSRLYLCGSFIQGYVILELQKQECSYIFSHYALSIPQIQHSWKMYHDCPTSLHRGSFALLIS